MVAVTALLDMVVCLKSLPKVEDIQIGLSESLFPRQLADSQPPSHTVSLQLAPFQLLIRPKSTQVGRIAIFTLRYIW